MLTNTERRMIEQWKTEERAERVLRPKATMETVRRAGSQFRMLLRYRREVRKAVAHAC